MKKLFLITASIVTYASAHVVEIKSEMDLQHVLESNKPIVIDIYKTDCPPCKRLAPVLDTISREYANKIAFIKISISTPFWSVFTETRSIFKVPTLIFWYQGQELLPRSKGVGDRQLRKLLDQFLNLAGR